MSAAPFKTWGKKQCVVIQESFYKTLPELPEVSEDRADIAWFLYDLVWNDTDSLYHLTLVRIVYTEFTQALQTITTPKAGDVNLFIELLQNKLEEKQAFEPEKPKNLEL